MPWYDIIGWLGAILVVAAYWMVSHHQIGAKSTAYQTMNLIGAVCLLASAYMTRNLPSIGLQLVWAGIAISALVWRRNA